MMLFIILIGYEVEALGRSTFVVTVALVALAPIGASDLLGYSYARAEMGKKGRLRSFIASHPAPTVDLCTTSVATLAVGVGIAWLLIFTFFPIWGYYFELTGAAHRMLTVLAHSKDPIRVTMVALMLGASLSFVTFQRMLDGFVSGLATGPDVAGRRLGLKWGAMIAVALLGFSVANDAVTRAMFWESAPLGTLVLGGVRSLQLIRAFREVPSSIDKKVIWQSLFCWSIGTLTVSTAAVVVLPPALPLPAWVVAIGGALLLAPPTPWLLVFPRFFEARHC